MKKATPYLYFVFLLLWSNTMMGQDILELKNGAKIFGEIVKVSKYNISFIDWHNASAEVQVLNRSEFSSIIDNYDDEAVMDKYYSGDKYRAIQLSITSLLNGSLSLDYQWAYNRNITLEVNGAWHGKGFNLNHAKEGLGLGGAAKIKLPALSYIKYKPKHVLHGSFLKLSLGLGSVNEQLFQSVSVSPGVFELAKINRNRNYIHFGPEIGYQWILGNLISIEGGVGIHVLEIKSDVTQISTGTEDFSERNYQFNDGDLNSNGDTMTKVFVKIGWIF